ncbi:MAG: hypothetical protein M3071_03855, partial [Actinomycetota bacterium]|nr:hypothetical protein [Actinomycetota bacterium]
MMRLVASPMRVRRFWIIVLISFLTVLVPALARADATPQTDLALLNQERAAWGLPTGITENPTWSADCAAHDSYERQNGGGLTHQEQPGSPGYTTGGAFAGANSILDEGAPWAALVNPFENAPIHLIQLFTPSLAQVGIDDSSGDVCVTTWPGMTGPPPAQVTITTYPGDGTSGFPTAENAQEGPFVPGDFVGIPQGTTAGREIFVYLDEPGQIGPAHVTIQQASLIAPSGPLQIATVDNSTGTIGPYLTGGIIIPVQPLPEGVQINASVTLAGPNGAVAHSWSFTTAKAPNASVTVTGTSITFSSSNPSSGLLRVFAPPGSGSYYILDQPISVGTSALATSRLPTGSQLQACVFQPAANGYDPAYACSVPFIISSGNNGGAGGGGGGGGGGSNGGGNTYTYRFGLSLSGLRLGISSVPRSAVGRTIMIKGSYQRRSCHKRQCSTTVVGARDRSIVVTSGSLSLSLPKVRRANRIVVTASMSAFTVAGNRFQFKPATIV